MNRKMRSSAFGRVWTPATKYPSTLPPIIRFICRMNWTVTPTITKKGTA
jgi:hypothetical protein